MEETVKEALDNLHHLFGEIAYVHQHDSLSATEKMNAYTDINEATKAPTAIVMGSIADNLTEHLKTGDMESAYSDFVETYVELKSLHNTFVEQGLLTPDSFGQALDLIYEDVAKQIRNSKNLSERDANEIKENMDLLSEQGFFVKQDHKNLIHSAIGQHFIGFEYIDRKHHKQSEALTRLNNNINTTNDIAEKVNGLTKAIDEKGRGGRTT